MSSNPRASASDIAAFLSHYNERVLNKYRTDAANTLYGYAGLYAEEVMKE